MRKDKPILFSAPMVLAILREIEKPGSGKTQTRRIVSPKLQSAPWKGSYENQFCDHTWPAKRIDDFCPDCYARLLDKCPYGKAGDYLWVRETYFQFGHWEPVVGAVTRKGKRQKWRFVADRSDVLFEVPQPHRKGRHAADPATPAWHQRLGRFMPRTASRLSLEVTDVRVERLQSISAEDARDEGVDRHSQSVRQMWLLDATSEQRAAIYLRACIWEYEQLWNTISGSGAWEANPFVVAVTFRPHLMNIDAFLKQRELSNVA